MRKDEIEEWNELLSYDLGLGLDETTLKFLGRVRQVLSTRRDVREQKTVGGIAFLLKKGVVCSVSKAGLTVRTGAKARAAALSRPHVVPLVLGGQISPGFVIVEPPGFRTRAALSKWIQQGLDFVATLPDKKPQVRKKPAELSLAPPSQNGGGQRGRRKVATSSRPAPRFAGRGNSKKATQ